MKVIHPGKNDRLEGGIKNSHSHQRKILSSLEEVEYTTGFEKDADIIHLNLLTPGAALKLKRAKRNGIKVVIHTHEIGENFAESFVFSSYLQPVVRRYVDWFYRRADKLIAPSQYAKETLADRGIETDCDVISNGIDPERFEGVDEMEKRSDQFTVVNLSLVFERKGLSDFVETAREVPEISFKWFGKKYTGIFLYSDIDAKIENSPENLCFPGFAEDIREVFTQGDAFFFPTKSETEGMSVMEAAYCGLPPVIRDIPVYEDIFTHEENCLKAGDPEGFAETIRRLKDDEKLREKISENAREMARKHTIEEISGDLKSAYRSALKQG